MTKIEKFLNQEINIKDIEVARGLYVASLGLFVFTAMFSSLFSVAFGNEVVNTASVYNSKIENKVHAQIETRAERLAMVDTVMVVENISEAAVMEKPELVFHISKDTVKAGESVKISWEAKNANKCTLMQNDKLISNAVKGDISSEPINNTSLIWISCGNNGGSDVSSEKVSVK